MEIFFRCLSMKGSASRLPTLDGERKAHDRDSVESSPRLPVLIVSTLIVSTVSFLLPSTSEIWIETLTPQAFFWNRNEARCLVACPRPQSRRVNSPPVDEPEFRQRVLQFQFAA